MELVNEIVAAEPRLAEMAPEDSAELLSAVLRPLILLLAPFAPYLAAELWEQMGEAGALLRHPWPEFDENLAREDEAEVPVQVNGKLRAVVRIPRAPTMKCCRTPRWPKKKCRHPLPASRSSRL